MTDDHHGIDFDLKRRGIEKVLQCRPVAIEIHQVGGGMDGDASTRKSLIHEGQFIGHEGPGGGVPRRGGIAHGFTLPGQVLGDDAAQIIVVVVKDQHPICRHGAGEYILGRQYLRQIEGFSGYLEGRIKPLGPACPGRHCDVVGAKAQGGLGVERAVGVHGDVAHLREGPHAVIANPSPGGHAGKLTLLQYPATPVIGLLGDRHLEALLGGDQRGFQSCGAAAHHQHVAGL